MAAYSYDRVIKIGPDTASLVDVSDRVNSCSFSWERHGGCMGGSLTIESAPFDDYQEIELGDIVKIAFKSGGAAADDWYIGLVTKLSTSLSGGLSIEVGGYAGTLLAEADPEGIFGTDALLGTVSGLTLSVETDRGDLGNGYHKYYVAAKDSLGVRVPSDWATVAVATTLVDLADADPTARRVSIAWTNVARAEAFRIYKPYWAADLGGAVGLGMVSLSGTPARYYYMDTAETEFYDDGTIDWESLPYETTLPASNTCRVPPLDDTTLDSGNVLYGLGTDVNSLALYLVDTYFNAGYDRSKITAGVGAAYNLDFLDLDDTETNLAEALQTLADFAGRIAWGVDGAGAVYFKDTIDCNATDFEDQIIKEWFIGAQYDLSELHDPDNPVTDVLLEVTRSAQRDSPTRVKVESNTGFENNAVGARIADFRRGTNLTYWKQTRARGHRRNDPRIFDVGVQSTSPDIPSNATLGATGAGLFGDYADVDAFEADFPNLGWLHRAYQRGHGAVAVEVLKKIRDELRQTDVNPKRGRRKRGHVLYMPGARSEYMAARGAGNVMRERRPLTGTWSATVGKVALRFDPGLVLVAVTTLKGDRYIMEVQSAKIDFTDDVTVSLEVGDPDISERARRDEQKVLANLAERKPTEQAVTGARHPFVRLAFDDLRPGATSLGRPRFGADVISAPIDHAHDLDPDAVNKNIDKDGANMPSVQRTFTVATLQALADKLDTTNAAYVRGLVYRTGDLAVVNGVQYRYDGASWVILVSWQAYTGA